MPHFPGALKESAAKYPDHAQNLELAASCAEFIQSENRYPVWERGFIARLMGDGTTNSLLSSPYKSEKLRRIWQEGWMMADDVLEEKPAKRAINPDTHCTSCGEVLSLYSHCWKCQYPPMDPKQDAAPAPYCNGQCGICSCISSPQPVATEAK